MIPASASQEILKVFKDYAEIDGQNADQYFEKKVHPTLFQVNDLLSSTSSLGNENIARMLFDIVVGERGKESVLLSLSLFAYHKPHVFIHVLSSYSADDRAIIRTALSHCFERGTVTGSIKEGLLRIVAAMKLE